MSEEICAKLLTVPQGLASSLGRAQSANTLPSAALQRRPGDGQGHFPPWHAAAQCVLQ